jgi:K+/H+ antiporter YhaU regulatory subunit KhtT
LLSLLQAAQLDTCRVSPGSRVAGKLIREIELRKQTGASIVGIERRQESLVNPGPDEEIEAGDLICLLGTPDQLKAASALLAGDRVSNSQVTNT